MWRALFYLSSLLFVFCCPVKSVASTADTVTINGTVYDLFTARALPGVSVINTRWGQTTATDGLGRFVIKALHDDTLFLFYPSYRTTKFSVADSILKKEYVLQIGIEPLNTGLSQAVIIKAPKTLEQIEKERKELGKTPRELDKPIIEPFSSPISALYDLFSQRAQEREKLKKQMIEDDRRKIFRELLDYYNENNLIDLPEEYYEDFTNYSKLSIDFLKTSSDYEITKTVVELFNKYARLNGIVK